MKSGEKSTQSIGSATPTRGRSMTYRSTVESEEMQLSLWLRLADAR